MPLERRTPMPRGDAQKVRDWQARGAKTYADKQRATPKPMKRSRPARNDSGWRAEVIAAHGDACVSCGDRAHVQADHLMPRSQGGPSVVENGLPLCGEFSRVTPGGCHPAKTASRLVIDPSWLHDAQVVWLASVGWVTWDEHGEPSGRGARHFGRMRRPMDRVERADGEGSGGPAGR